MGGSSRDREATRRKLIEAVGEMLAREGFSALGVNAVARRAGVDKVLIYRYFGGMPGLIAAFGREGDFWPPFEEFIGSSDPEAFARKDFDQKYAIFMRNYNKALRSRPLTLEILAWELIARNELTIELENVRTATTLKLLPLFEIPDGLLSAVSALSAVLVAASTYLCIRARNIRIYSGIDLQSDEGWACLDQMQALMVRSVLEKLRSGKECFSPHGDVTKQFAQLGKDLKQP